MDQGGYRFGGEHHYSCQACGLCCRATRVEVTPEYAAGVRGKVPNRHGLDDPFEVDPQTGNTRLRHVDGACVFLQEDNRCGIHAALGYMGKPAPCRWFPFTVYRPASGPLRVRLSYYCPTVVADHGAGTESHVQELRADSIPLPLPERYEVGTGALSASEMDAVDEELLRHLEAPDLARGVAAVGLYVDELARALSAPDAVPAAVIGALGTDAARAERLARPRAFARPRDARLMLAPFLLVGLPAPAGRLALVGNFLALVRGSGRIAAFPAGRPVDLGQLGGLAWNAPGGERVFRRYLTNLVASRALVADFGLELGTFMLGVAYALARWYARASAIEQGRTQVSDEDLARALPPVDGFHIHHNRRIQQILGASSLAPIARAFLSPRRVAGLVLA